MYRFSLFLFSIIIFVQQAISQIPPKREFRGAWIATVSNIDWPSKGGLPAVQQQQEFISRLDKLKALGCNAVIVQIRPASDAFYPSEIEPWSRYLTGRQGQPPFPNYDPLKFMIEETHKRHMEFHAWFNPYRALTDSRKNPNPPDHITHKHPDWIVSYGGKSYLNPGIPQAREYVIKVIMDVVKRYDLDAVHLDDYFYPYRIAGQEFNDNNAFKTYCSNMGRDDWRRQNVSLFISTLNTNIKSVKPHVKLGISPFGVWRNASKDPEGSETRGGQTCYDDLYADVVLWMQKGWIDYLMPQLYWEHNHKLAAFDILMPWWEEHTFKRHTYYGLGVYRMVKPTSAWVSSKELLWQMRDVRYETENPGYTFYSASIFDKISPVVSDSVAEFNSHIAFPPVMKWLDSIPPAAPEVKAIPSAGGTLLQWQQAKPTDDIAHYAVYRFTNDEPVSLKNPQNIISLQSGREFLDATANRYKKCTYIVTSLDRLWNESPPSNMVFTSAN